METITIQCTECDSRLRLSASLLERVKAKTGRVSCKSCAQSIRVDGRGDGFSFEGAVPYQEIDELDGDEFVSDPAASPVFSTLPPERMRLSGAPASELVSSEATDGAVAGNDEAAVEGEPLGGDTMPAEAPFYRNELSSLSPHTIDDAVEEELARLPSGAASSPFNSSPFNEEMAPESVDDLYAQVAVPRSERSEQLAQRLEERLAQSDADQEAPLPPELTESAQTSSEARIVAASPMARRRTDAPPSPPTTRTKPQTSIPPAPPRPWELSKAPATPAVPVNPFEGEFGLSEPPPMAQTVHLTHDGRLINASDEPESRSSKARGALWGALAVAAALGLAIVGVQSGALASIQGQLTQLGDGGSAPRLARIADVMVGTRSVGASQPQPAGFRSDVGPIYTSLQSEDDIPINEKPVDVAANDANDVSETSEQDAPESATTSQHSASAARVTPSEGDDTTERDGAAEAVDSTSSDAASADEAAGDEASADDGAGAEAAEASAEAPIVATDEDAAPLPAFDRTAAGVALNEATAQAASCRKPGDPSGMARIVISFAPSGRATRATVSGPPFAGTPTGGCIASRFRGTRVPAFSGSMVTVSKTVVVR